MIHRSYVARLWLASGRTPALVAAVAFLCSRPSLTMAGVAIGVAPTYPGFVHVGATNVPVNLTFTNTSTTPEDGGTVSLSNIRFTPSCKSDTAPCPGGDVDPGVFEVVGPATGAAGNACAGKSFQIGSPDATTGEVTFTAQGGAAMLQPPGTANDLDKCVINFFVNVLKVPTKDGSLNPGLQTNAPARVTGTASVNAQSATPTGAALTTVLPLETKEPAPALSASALIVVAMVLTAFGVFRVRRRGELFHR
jgi:hypothetical protein